MPACTPVQPGLFQGADAEETSNVTAAALVTAILLSMAVPYVIDKHHILREKQVGCCRHALRQPAIGLFQ